MKSARQEKKLLECLNYTDLIAGIINKGIEYDYTEEYIGEMIALVLINIDIRKDNLKK